MASVESLSDGELRHKLAEYGFQAGPVTDTSRKVLLKKLKLLMVQQGRSKDSTGTGKWRRSSSNFSSGEDSENGDNTSRFNNTMPPPSSNVRSPRRKSSSSTEKMSHRKEVNLNTSKTNAIAYNSNKKRPSRFSLNPGTRPVLLGTSADRNFSTRTASSSNRDDFETGSDSDVDSKKWPHSSSHSSQSSNVDSVSYSSNFLSRMSQRRKTDENDGEKSRVSNLMRYRKSLHENNGADSLSSSPRSSTPPFQSNFVQRLSGSLLSEGGNRGTTPSSIFDVKETDDTTTNSPNGIFSPSRWTSTAVQSDISQEFMTTEDETRLGWNTQFISMILLIVAALFFTLLAIVYFNIRSANVSFSYEDYSNNYPICTQDTSVKSSDLCIEAEYLLDAVKLAKMLHPELVNRGINHKCFSAQSPIMTHHEVVKWIMKKHKDYLESTNVLEVVRALKVLVISNPHWGICVTETPVQENDGAVLNHHRLVNIGGVYVAEPNLPLFCYLKFKLLELLLVLMFAAFGVCSLYGLKLSLQWYMKHRERDKAEVYSMVERIIDLLVKNHYDGPPGMPRYLAVNHARDQLIPPSDRKRLSKVWEKAVEWIKHSESRVRCELQSIAGEEFPVWRWLPSPSSNTSVFFNSQ